MNLNDYFIIGINGPCSVEYDEDSINIIYHLLTQAILKQSDGDILIAVATGMSDIGINKVSHRWAYENGIPIIGVACPKVWEHPVWKVDKAIVAGEDWGDESQTFVAILNALIKFSNTPQANAEAKLANMAGIEVLDLTKKLKSLSNSPYKAGIGRII